MDGRALDLFRDWVRAEVAAGIAQRFDEEHWQEKREADHQFQQFKDELMGEEGE